MNQYGVQPSSYGGQYNQDTYYSQPQFASQNSQFLQKMPTSQGMGARGQPRIQQQAPAQRQPYYSRYQDEEKIYNNQNQQQNEPFYSQIQSPPNEGVLSPNRQNQNSKASQLPSQVSFGANQRLGAWSQPGSSQQFNKDTTNNYASRGQLPPAPISQFQNDQPLNLNLTDHLSGIQEVKSDRISNFSPRSDFMSDGAEDLGNVDENADPMRRNNNVQQVVYGRPQQRSNFMDSTNVQNSSMGSQQIKSPPRMSAAGRGAQPIKGSQAQNPRQKQLHDLNNRANDYAEQQLSQQSYQPNNHNNSRKQISQNLSRGDHQEQKNVEAATDNFGADSDGEEQVNTHQTAPTNRTGYESHNQTQNYKRGAQEQEPSRRAAREMAQDFPQQYKTIDVNPRSDDPFWDNQSSINKDSKEVEDQKKQKMYADLYHKVMKEKNPNTTAHRTIKQVQKTNTFDIYKDGWNTMQDKSDKDYQKQLRQVNHQTARRLEDAQRRQELKLQQNAIKHKKDDNLKEMQECTFSPRVQVSNHAKQYNDKFAKRKFSHAQEQFLAKKHQTIEEARKRMEQSQNNLSTKDLMSKGSKRIIRDQSQKSMNKSASQNSFLQRNYYSRKDRDKSRSGLSNPRGGSKTRDLSSSNTYMRDMDGSKLSFLNSSRSGYLEKPKGPKGERLFSPRLNERSRIMSPRDKDSTFFMLHQQALNQQHKQDLKTFHADRIAYETANQGVLENVNERSDALLVKQFYNRFCAVIQDQIEQSNQIYLVDVLDQLHFISEENLMKQSMKMSALLKQQKESLFIDTDAGQFRGESEDITKNLFKVCCAILNLRPKQRGQNPLDDHILRQYAEQINSQNQETIIIEQLQILKQLVNRKAFSLTDKQITLINRKFLNMSHNCKEFNRSKQKQENIKKVEQETQPFFAPRINPRSRDIDRNLTQNTTRQSNSKSQTRTDRMHGYAEKYNEHKNQLRQAYKDKDVEGLNFEPELNPRSLKIVKETQKSFTDRTMDQYMNKHKRVDKDPNQIEFEKQQKECTFRPTIASTKPAQVNPGPGIKTPAGLTRGQAYLEEKEFLKKEGEHALNMKKIQSSEQPDDKQYTLEQFLLAAPNREIEDQPEPEKSEISSNPHQIIDLPMSHGGYSLPQPPETPKKAQQIKPPAPVREPLQMENIPQSQDRPQFKPSSNTNNVVPSYPKPPPLHQQRPLRTLMNSYLPVVEEPICVLKIELDGEHIEEIKVFENDDPNEIVQKFGDDFNLSQGARQRLLEQIQEQIQMDDEEG